MADKIQAFNFHYDNPNPDLVKMVSGRHGEWNEYVEFCPYNSNIRFVAQLCLSGNSCSTNVFEIHPGRRGKVKTLATGYSAPIFGIEDAFQAALKIAQG